MSELFLKIIERIKDIKKIRTDVQVAEALDMTKNNLYAFKTRPNLPLKQIHTFCSREGVRLEYIIDGKPPIYGSEPGPWPKIPGHGFGTKITEPSTERNGVEEQKAGHKPSQIPSDISSDDPLFQTGHVLNSDTEFKTALDANIKAFYAAVNMRTELNVARAKLSHCEMELANYKKEMEQMKEDHHKEIEELRQAVHTMQESLKPASGGE